MPLVDCGVYVDGARIEEPAGVSDAIRDARARGGLVWIGLYRPEAAEMHEIAALLGLHPLAVEDTLHGHQRAKLEQYGDVSFLVLRPARYLDDTETVEFGEVHIFIGDDFVVTVRHAETPNLAAVRARAEQHPDLIAKGTFAIVWAICDEVVDQYAPVSEGLENDIDEIEDELFTGHPDVSKRIFALQREVIAFQHAVNPLPSILERLQEVVRSRLDLREVPALRDVEDHALRVVERADGFRHTLDSALTLNATLVELSQNEEMRRMVELSLTQNDQVKKVSGWAAILFAPTLVGTIYGMNFDNMPELHWQFGYPIALTLMAATSVTLYLVFKRRNWL